MEPQHDQICLLARIDHPVQRLHAQKWRVAIKNNDIARKSRKGSPRLIDRMGRAQLFFLQDNFGVFIKSRGGFGHRFGTMPGDDDDFLGLQSRACTQRMGQHGGLRDGMKDLGQIRFHTRALARGKNDQSCAHHEFSLCFVGSRFIR